MITVSRLGSGFGRVCLFSGFFSCFTGTFGSGVAAAVSCFAILRDKRAWVLLLRTSLLAAEVSDIFADNAISVIFSTIQPKWVRKTQEQPWSSFSLC